MEPDFIDDMEMRVPEIDPSNLIDLDLDDDDGDPNLLGDVQPDGFIQLEQLQDDQLDREDTGQQWDPGTNVGQYISRRRGETF